ncbi:hypothetical protein FXO37_08377, partial [Capsicum annuum]
MRYKYCEFQTYEDRKKHLHECCTIAKVLSIRCKKTLDVTASTSPNAFVEKRQILNVATVVNAPVDSWIKERYNGTGPIAKRVAVRAQPLRSHNFVFLGLV